MKHIKSKTLESIGYNMNHKHRRNNGFFKAYKLLVIGEQIKEVVDVRFYQPASQVYCCIWINDSSKGIHGNGSGVAGGWGYDRPSEAFEKSLKSMGIDCRYVSGAGDSAVEDAIKEIGELMGYTNTYLVKCHE